MGTNSLIGFTTPSGKVRNISCCLDGNPSQVGRRLFDHYQDPTKIEQLIALGDISILGAKLAPEPGEEHSLHKYVPGVTLAYHRDDGRELEIYEESVPSFRSVHNNALPWIYHFYRGVWWVRKNTDPRWERLERRLERIKKDPTLDL